MAKTTMPKFAQHKSPAKPKKKAVRILLRLRQIASSVQFDHYMVRPQCQETVLGNLPQGEWKSVIIKQLKTQGMKPYYWGEDRQGLYCYAEPNQPSYATVAKLNAEKSIQSHKRSK